MNSETAPSWVPTSGHALRHAGIHFGAVRIEGILGEQAAYELLQFTDFRAGPIVREDTGARNMYFLLPPQTAAAHRWPAGVRALSRNAGCAAFVGVPALSGATWPLRWQSRPTVEVPFVDGELLREMVERAARAVR
ncbi:hypothetical protein AB0P36_05655 [Streptomyces flavidovirens]|uniref:hypothetical protein n=1 Tax=Streptomyces flavidovirens TaxID=67298 RepID=UPI003412FF63